MNKDKIGGKTSRLFDLEKLGLNVPKFSYISADFLKQSLLPNLSENSKTILNTKSILEISEKIADKLNCESYAVRSSALIEDSEKSSFAGQFKTLINIKKEGLSAAIQEVSLQAFQFLHGEIEKFSIIIQEYIEPNISGITFTRNPNGNREMIMEYHHGRGEDVVGGKIKPEKLEFYWNYLPKNLANKLPGLETAVVSFKKIENFYKSPQDIEWCIKNNTWYFLQARPITTISKKNYQQSLFLDDALPKNEKFYFEKTEISEIAPRPTQITYDLLKEIYKTGGPIDLAYKKHKINYKSWPILKIIGNELFINREAELKTLLPAYTFLETLTPKFSSFKGLLTTLVNSFRLQFIKLKNYKTLFVELKNAIEEKSDHKQLKEFLAIFFKHYSLIFEINLLTKTAIDNLQRLIKKEQINISTLLNYYNFIKKEDIDLTGIKLKNENLSGNSLEVADESKFTATIIGDSKDENIENWWNKLPSFKKNLLENPLKQAIIYNRLREINRWLVVKDIQTLKNILLEIAKEQNFTNPKNIYFSNLKNIIDQKILDEKIYEKIKNEYLKYSEFESPKTLTYIPIDQASSGNPIGLSAGIAEGILVSKQELEDQRQPNAALILYTKILSPELTKYFPHIKGIISEGGGLLSHLAIVARESKIPVIANFTLNQNDIKLGTKIKMDGGTGIIQKTTNI